MKHSLLSILFFFLPLQCNALTEKQIEELADMTAIIIYLKNVCYFNELKNKNITINYHQEQLEEISNEDEILINQQKEESYWELYHLPLPTNIKCRALKKHVILLSSTPINAKITISIN